MRKTFLALTVALLTGFGGHLADNLFDHTPSHSDHWRHKAVPDGGSAALGGAVACVMMRRPA